MTHFLEGRMVDNGEPMLVKVTCVSCLKTLLREQYFHSSLPFGKATIIYLHILGIIIEKKRLALLSQETFVLQSLLFIPQLL